MEPELRLLRHKAERNMTTVMRSVTDKRDGLPEIFREVFEAIMRKERGKMHNDSEWSLRLDEHAEIHSKRGVKYWLGGMDWYTGRGKANVSTIHASSLLCCLNCFAH